MKINFTTAITVASFTVMVSVCNVFASRKTPLHVLRSNNIEALTDNPEGAFVEIYGCYYVDNGMSTDYFGPCWTSKPSCLFEAIGGMPIVNDGKTYYPCGNWKTVYANCTNQGYCWEMGISERLL